MSTSFPKRLEAWSAAEIARGIADGFTTTEAVAEALLARIGARDGAIKAWAAVDAELVRSEARQRDAQRGGRGVLHGVPFGVKDIIETADLPTGMGAAYFKGYRTRTDAPSVALPRTAGAIVLGKTVTSEFASLSPVETRNPHDTSRMTGVSSAGSAAAVADLMVPVALGTQTGGSVLRPASYCGCIGFKPTFGAYNIANVKPAVISFDTLGLLARTMEDVALFHAVLTGELAPAAAAAPTAGGAPRIGVCRTPMWADAEPETHTAVEDAARRLSAAGATVSDVAWPAALDGMMRWREAITNVDRAHNYAHEWRVAPETIGPVIRRNIEDGLKTRRADYNRSLKALDAARRDAEALFEGVDVLLAPCVVGVAPPHNATQVDPGFQQIWTVLHTPAISLPTHAGSGGFPVGIQLVAPRWEDQRLIRVADWVLATLGRAG